MVDKNKTEIVCILDRSGSMSSIWADMMGGLDTMIKDQKDEPGKAEVTMVVFDYEYNMLCDALDIKKFDLKEITKDVAPRGSTSLLDAIGRTINTVGNRLKNTKEEDRPGNVIFSIVTDGYENSSSEFSYAEIKKMITHQTEKYNWVFTYLGANQDAFDVGDSIGIAHHFCSDIDDLSQQGVQATYSSVSDLVKGCRTRGALAYVAAVANSEIDSLDEIYKKKKQKTSTN